MSKESYDDIAEVYATDMGQSMRFDDVGYYQQLCLARGGRTLEFGCGTGRILLPLLMTGIDIEGVDQSSGMLDVLQRDAAALGLQARVYPMSMLDFTASKSYQTLLAPYSVVTYLTSHEQLDTFFESCREALLDTGLLVVDTFIPRPVQAFNDFRQDYRRPHGSGWLTREKRIAVAGECNCIERRYTLVDGADNLLRSWTTRDVIRPWEAAELVVAASRNGLRLAGTDYDYGAGKQDSAQFVALRLQAISSPEAT